MKKKILVFMFAAFAVMALVFTGCTTAADDSGASSAYSITFPESYAQTNYWGATASTYTLKFIFIKDTVLAGLEPTSDVEAILTDANESYVFGDATLGNGSVAIASLTTVAITPISAAATATYSGASVSKSGSNLTVMIDPKLIGDYLQLKTTSETNGQAASNVASGYTPCLIGSITSASDASADANCVGTLWNTYALKMSK